MEIYRWLLVHADILGLLIDFIALIVTIILTIGIYKLERIHEKEREMNEQQTKKRAIIEAAKVFLIDNDEEIEYLQLAEIASQLNLKRKHCRNLITRYLRCSGKLQQEILRQANTLNIKISMIEVQQALIDLQVDLEKNHFGRNILYDGAKYLHRAFERWSNKPIDVVNPYIFDNLKRYSKQSAILQLFPDYEVSLSCYMRDYLQTKELEIDKNKIIPPIDMVFQECDLGTCDESIMTFWIMRIIIDACYTIKEVPRKDLLDESLIQTQEDMYYYTLAVLCQTYGAGGKTGE